MSRKVSFLIHFSLLIFGIGIIFLLLYFAGFEQSLTLISRLSFSWMVVVFFIYGLSWFFRTLRLGQLISPDQPKISKKELFSVQIAGYAINNFMPAKAGDVMTIAFLKKGGLSLGHATMVIIHTRILDLLALIILPIFFYLFTKETLSYQYLVYYIFLSALVLGLSATFFGLIIQKHYLNRFIIFVGALFNSAAWKRFCHRMQKFVALYESLAKDKSLWVSSLILSCIIWGLESFTTIALAAALSVKIPFYTIIIAVSIGNLGKIIPSTPGSIGIYESLLSVYFIQCGIAPDKAVVLSTLDHLSKKLFVLAFGIPAFLKAGAFHLFRARKDSDPQM